jgi:uncharacterized protein with GYD domain
MPLYLLRHRLTPEAWTALARNPQDLRRATEEVVRRSAKLRLRDFWYAFGEHDCYILLEGEGEVDVAVIATALAAGGGLRLIGMVRLFSSDEISVMLDRAQHALARPHAAAEAG